MIITSKNLLHSKNLPPPPKKKISRAQHALWNPSLGTPDCYCQYNSIQLHPFWWRLKEARGLKHTIAMLIHNGCSSRCKVVGNWFYSTDGSKSTFGLIENQTFSIKFYQANDCHLPHALKKGAIPIPPSPLNPFNN